nr:hypothetical protein [Tanacetum cinerariifolium]
DSSSKFYMYPRFIQLIIQNQLGDLSTHNTKYTSPALTQKVFANIRRVGKGCSGVETPLFDGMLVAGEPEEQGNDVQDQYILLPTPPTPPPQQPQDLPSTSQEALDASAALTRRVEHLEHDKVAQDLEITKLETRVKKLEKANKVKALKLRRLKKDEGIALMDDEGAEKKAEDAQVAGDEQEDEPEVQEAVEVVTTAKLITEVVAAVSKSVTAANATTATIPAATITPAPVRVVAASTRKRKGVVIRDPEEESTAKTPAETNSKDKGKGIMVEEPKSMKKKQQVEMDEEYARKFHEELNKDIDWDVAIDNVKQKAKEDSYVQRYQKASKRRKLNEEVEDLKHHLEIVPDEDDDVYTEATPLARKVPVVDYQIIQLNNKPHYKIIRANGTHQLYVSFITLLKNFDREDLESLVMFRRPDGQDQVWKSQRSVHGQAKKIPTLEVYIGSNVKSVMLRVEEQSEMSLELIRFTRQQLQEGHHE